MYVHTTKDGKEIKLCDMSISHLENTIKMIEKKAKDGIVIQNEGGGFEPDDFWYDEYILKDEQALVELDYYEYTDELKRRKTSSGDKYDKDECRDYLLLKLRYSSLKGFTVGLLQGILYNDIPTDLMVKIKEAIEIVEENY